MDKMAWVAQALLMICWAKKILSSRLSSTRVPIGVSSLTHLKRNTRPNTGFKASDCSLSRDHSSSICTPLTPVSDEFHLLTFDLSKIPRNYRKFDLPNFCMSSVKTPGSDSMRHQLPVSDSPILKLRKSGQNFTGFGFNFSIDDRSRVSRFWIPKVTISSELW